MGRLAPVVGTHYDHQSKASGVISEQFENGYSGSLLLPPRPAPAPCSLSFVVGYPLARLFPQTSPTSPPAPRPPSRRASPRRRSPHSAAPLRNLVRPSCLPCVPLQCSADMVCADDPRAVAREGRREPARAPSEREELAEGCVRRFTSFRSTAPSRSPPRPPPPYVLRCPAQSPACSSTRKT